MSLGGRGIRGTGAVLGGSGISLSGGGGGFTGLLNDYPDAAAAYSVRRLSSTYTGSLIEVRRTVSATTVTADVAYDSNNELSLDSLITVTGGSSSATNLGEFVAAAGYLDPDSLGSGADSFVRTWYDQSGNAVDFTQTSTSAQLPIITAGVINLKDGKVAASISSTQFMSVPSSTGSFNYLHDGTSSSYFSVASFGNSSNPNNTYTLFSNTNNINTQIGYYFRYDDRAASGRNNRLVDYNVNGSSPPSCNVELNDVITPNQNNLIFSNIDADNVILANRAEYYINNGVIINNNTKNGVATLNNASNNMFLGRLPDGTFTMEGTFSEAVFWDSDQSANRAGIQNNINTYFSIYSPPGGIGTWAIGTTFVIQ